MNRKVKEMIGGCCVCSDERGWSENPLVYCDGTGCTVAVHQGNKKAFSSRLKRNRGYVRFQDSLNIWASTFSGWVTGGQYDFVILCNHACIFFKELKNVCLLNLVNFKDLLDYHSIVNNMGFSFIFCRYLLFFENIVTIIYLCSGFSTRVNFSF